MRSIIVRCLAPLRWAIRHELERSKSVDLLDTASALQRQALAETVEYVKQHMAQVDSTGSDLEILSLALEQVKNRGGLFLEFGVFSGRTINHIAAQIDHKIYGFDSFEGLPERWRDGIGSGHFKLKEGSLPKVRANVELVKGWFEKTLPRFLQEHAGDVSFMHVDCDLYSSTTTIFSQLESRIKPGTVIVFDEYFNYPGWKEGEFKAFQEFISRVQLQYEYLSYNRINQQVCIRVSD